MNLARRIFLRNAALAPVVAPMMARDAAVTAGKELTGWVPSVMGTMGGGGVPVSSGGWNIWSAAKKLLSWRFDRWYERTSHSVFFRDGPFDHDIAALRSTSYAWKVAKQRKRDEATRRSVRDWRRKVYPEEEYNQIVED